MFSTFRSRLTYANVMASIAVFIALGGTSMAAATLVRNSVKKRHIAARAVGKSEIRSGAVGKSEISTGGVGKSEIRADAVGNSEIKPDSVRGEEILESSLGRVPDAAKLGGQEPGEYMAGDVRVVTATAEATTPATATAACAANEHAISGGGAVVDLATGNAATSGALRSSEPVVTTTGTGTAATSEVTGWTATTEGAGGTAARAFALCVPDVAGTVTPGTTP